MAVLQKTLGEPMAAKDVWQVSRGCLAVAQLEAVGAAQQVGYRRGCHLFSQATMLLSVGED